MSIHFDVDEPPDATPDHVVRRWAILGVVLLWLQIVQIIFWFFHNPTVREWLNW